MAPRPVWWHPVPEPIASVIAGTRGAEVPLQHGEPPPNAGFPGERLPRQPVEAGCLAGRRPPWTSAQTSIRTGSTSLVNRDSEYKPNNGTS